MRGVSVSDRLKSTVRLIRMADVELKPDGDSGDAVTVIEKAMAELRKAKAELKRSN